MRFVKIGYIICIFRLIGNLLGMEAGRKTRRCREMLFLIIVLFQAD
jgi:hypothetical protein